MRTFEGVSRLLDKLLSILPGDLGGLYRDRELRNIRVFKGFRGFLFTTKLTIGYGRLL